MLSSEKKVKSVNKKLLKFILLTNNILTTPNIFKKANELSLSINPYAYSLDIVLDNGYTVHISSYGIVIRKKNKMDFHITEKVKNSRDLPASVYHKLIYSEYEARKAAKDLLKEFSSPGHLVDYTSTSFPNIKSTFTYNVKHTSKTVNVTTIE